MALIVVGGIGFFVWEDLSKNKFHFRAYTLQTKLVLTVTGLLIVLPTLWFFCWEFDSWDLTLGQRFWAPCSRRCHLGRRALTPWIWLSSTAVPNC